MHEQDRTIRKLKTQLRTIIILVKSAANPERNKSMHAKQKQHANWCVLRAPQTFGALQPASATAFTHHHHQHYPFTPPWPTTISINQWLSSPPFLHHHPLSLSAHFNPHHFSLVLLQSLHLFPLFTMCVTVHFYMHSFNHKSLAILIIKSIGIIKTFIILL